MNKCGETGTHARPVHLHLATGFAWVCLSCEKQLAGKPVNEKELRTLVEFIKVSGLLERPAKTKTALLRAKEKEMDLEIKVLAGAESKAFLVDLTKQIDRLERLAGKKSRALSSDDEGVKEDPEAQASADLDEDDFNLTPKKKTAAKKTTAAFESEDAEDEEALEAASEEDDEAEEAPKKKAKKVTLDDVNDACKAYAKENSVKATKALLLKKFKTQSISEIPAEKYSAVIAAMSV